MISDWCHDLRVIIGLRLLLIFFTLFSLSWLALRHPHLIFSLVGLTLFLLVQVGMLFNALQRIYSQLEDFFDNLRSQDTTRLPVPVFYQGRKLAKHWEEIQADIQSLRERNEALLGYHSVLLEKIPVPLLRIQGKDVELLNAAGRQLFGRSRLHQHDLTMFGDDFAHALVALKPGAQQQMHLQIEQHAVPLTASATRIHTSDGDFKIVSLQVIQQELDRQQIGAWQQLVQVLSHEIMNSITPIRSLTSTASDLLAEYRRHPGAEALFDIEEALSTVNRRSTHLMNFVDAYRTVAQPLTLNLRAQSLKSLFGDIAKLFAGEMQNNYITFTSAVNPDHLELIADVTHIEQALINLVKNSIEALKDCSPSIKIIQLRAYLHPGGRLVIDVSDNGPGVHHEKSEQIFVPFFTSKHSGTGIGLFIVRQIMQAHGGSVKCIPQSRGSCFRLMF